MADIRLSALIRRYSIGLDRLVSILRRDGYNVDLNPNAKVSEECIPYLERALALDIDILSDDVSNTSIKRVSFNLRVLYYDDLGRIVTNGFSHPELGTFSYGVITPQTVSYLGMPVPFDRANALLNSIVYVGAEITTRFLSAIGKQCALLAFDASEVFPQEYESFFKESFKDGEIYNVELTGETPNYRIVSVKNTGIVGVIPKSIVPVGYSIEYLQLEHKALSPLDYSLFEWPSVIKDITAPYADSVVAAFLGDAAMSAISEQDLTLVKELLRIKPDINRREADLLTGVELYFQLNDCWLAYEHNIEKIKGKSFWIAVSNDDKREPKQRKLYLYHEKPTILIEITVTDSCFEVTQIATEENSGSDARRFIRSFNRSAELKVSSKYLHFIRRDENPPNGYDHESVYNIVSRLDDFNTVILPTINDVINNRLAENAHDYSILAEFLRYQISIEKHALGDPIHLSPDRLKPASGNYLNSRPAISFFLSEDEAHHIIGGDSAEAEAGTYVTVIDDAGHENRSLTGVISYRSGSFVYEFKNPKVNIKDFFSEGISIRRYSNTKHLDIQTRAIYHFLSNPKSIFHNLVIGGISTPDEEAYSSIEYFNQKFYEQEEGSKQCHAVRKALGNKNLVLIQGPPGTGKTTIIVEIIKQLVKEGKKVLVCSQAHAAVANIRERFDIKKDKIKILRIDDEGDVESWAEDFHPEDLHAFLEKNRDIVSDLAAENPDIDHLLADIDTLNYGTKDRTSEYRDRHRYVINNRDVIGSINKEVILDLFPRLLNVPGSLNERLLEAQLYQSMDVIMGTCIGIGMNSVFSSDSVHFDTVIIDEAAKANMAETLVPMRYGDRFVLVGDHNQLPPYVDSEQIEGFVQYQRELMEGARDGKRDRILTPDIDETYSALSNSVFAYFFNHPNFPEDNKVTLNYQYRMHPDIGDYISNLFYGGKLRSGKGTEKNVLPIPGYPDAVTFIDTARRENNYEKRSPDFSYYNPVEAEIIIESLIPRLMPILAQDNKIKVGIITPYKAQYRHLRHELKGSGFEDCVHTIDSIQGSEFEIVIFSFVRSFSLKSTSKVGFIDDMRRLNVSLSRAKKKLFLIGNSRTLLNEDAHFGNQSNTLIKPIDVFRKICVNTERISKADDLALFLAHAPSKGTLFKNCKYREMPSFILVDIAIEDRIYKFPLPKQNALTETIDVVYKGCDSGKPQFSISYYNAFKSVHAKNDLVEGVINNIVSPSSGSQSNQDLLSVFFDIEGINGRVFLKKCKKIVGDTILVQVHSFDDEKNQVKFVQPAPRKLIVAVKIEFPYIVVKDVDGGQFSISVGKQWYYLIQNQTYTFRPITKDKYIVSLEKQFEEFMGTHLFGSRFSGIVTSEDNDNYYVNVDGIICLMNKRACFGKKLSIGDTYTFKIFRGYENTHDILLSLVR